MLREFWDCRPKVATLTKNDALAATDAHVSVIAHCTIHELKERLQRDRTLISNGFFNRFVTVLVKRGQILPFGSEPPRAAFIRVARDLAGALDLARRWGRSTLLKTPRSYGPSSTTSSLKKLRDRLVIWLRARRPIVCVLACSMPSSILDVKSI